MASKLDELIKGFNKTYKENIAARGIYRIETLKIPFSSPRINYMTYGGLPRAKLVEFSGEENGGKTTTALDIVANAQQLFEDEYRAKVELLESHKTLNKSDIALLSNLKAVGPQQIVYIDCENTLDEDWAENLGVDTSKLIVIKPQTQTAEQIFQMSLDMMETGETGLVVLDSLGVMLSGQAFEKTMEEKTYGGIAAALTLFSKKAELLCGKYGCTFIGINQMREDMNSQHGGKKTTGGLAWKHNCALRLIFRKGAYIDEKGTELKRNAEDPAGNLVSVHLEKTKVFKPDRRLGFYTLNYDSGIDWIADTVDVAMKYGLILRSGSWFNFIDIETGEIIADDTNEPIKLQGRPAVIQYLKDYLWLLEEITEKIQKQIEKA
jgi:recombination protein RecA